MKKKGMKIDRRRFLTAMGLGAGSLYLPSMGWRPSKAKASGDLPVRVVFFITPHGTVPPNWNLGFPGMEGADYERDITGLSEAEFSPILRPLHRHRDRLLVVDGLSRPSVIGEEQRVFRDNIGHDGNGHHLMQAHLLTCNWTLQRSGSTCIGGSRSIDQVLGDRVGVPGRWANRVYGYRHQHPYSWLASGEPAAREEDPSQAFRDMMGLLPDESEPTEPTEPAPPTREELIDAARTSVLDFAAQEFDRVAPRLGSEDRMKLERHRQLIRDLEVSLAARMSGGGGTTVPGGATCDPTFAGSGGGMEQFAQLTTLALSCDLTRVTTFVARPLENTEFGVPAGVNMHQDIAHNSTPDGASYTPEAEAHMTEYNRVYAEQFAYLLDQMASVPEAGETLLDHSVVVWLTELGTGTHHTYPIPNVIAGGGCGYFNTGRYVHFTESALTPFSWGGPFRIGPPQARLYVDIFHALGQTDVDYVGLPEVMDQDGNPISMRGPLPMLRA